jgi:predicted nucleotidyltransferase component of viral defense system
VTAKPIRNTAASVRQRLLNRAREQGDDFQLLLTRYCIERLLYRLSQSEHADRFILKGATLFLLWGGGTYRPTRDLDLLGRGDSSPSHMVEVFKAVCATKVEDDGLEFDPSTVQAREIREGQEYGGVRVEMTVRLGKARLELQVDVGFGDALVPRPRKVDFPSLLGFPQARVSAYRRETVVAEKFQAMVALGIANSRMKDFYDLWTFAKGFEFGGKLLCQALKATFNRRRTPLPTEAPLALTDEFCGDATKQTQWSAFVRKNSLDAGGQGLAAVVAVLRRFLMPPTQAVASDMAFEQQWPAGGPWGR